jgi:outer membrane protein OmpA-like peptidoglycan-associated protein
MKKIFFMVCLGYLTVLTSGNTQVLSGNLGTSWLKIAPSTRYAGMGDSGLAVPDAYDEADINPAGLGLIGGTYLSLSQNFWAQSLSAQHLIFTQATTNGDGFSVGANFMNFGNIDTYNVTGNVLTATGSYSPIGLNLYAAYAISLGSGLRAGLTGHFIYDDIQQSFPDKTAALDAGLYYQLPKLPFSLSAVLTNLGWNIDDATLPVEVKTGAAYQLTFGPEKTPHLLTLSGEADWFLNDGNYTQLGLGAEYWYKNLIAIRAGYQFSNIGDLTGLDGLSLGAGIRYLNWQIDYALITLGELGVANQISLSLKLGDNEKPTATPTASPTPTPTSTMAAIPAMTPTFTPIPVEAVFGQKEGATWSITENSLTIYSDFKSKTPRAKDIELLDKLASFLLANPNLQITINGYTDNKGPKWLNDKLSIARAESTKKYLLSKNIPAETILSTQGHGAEDPIEDNSTDEGRSKNRRIVISWTPIAPASLAATPQAVVSDTPTVEPAISPAAAFSPVETPQAAAPVSPEATPTVEPAASPVTVPSPEPTVVKTSSLSLDVAGAWWGDTFDAQKDYEILLNGIPDLIAKNKMAVLGKDQRLYFTELKTQGADHADYLNKMSGYYARVAKSLFQSGRAKDADFYLKQSLRCQADNPEALALQAQMSPKTP